MLKVLHVTMMNARNQKKESKEKLGKFRSTREPVHRKEYADSNKRYRRMTRVKKQEFKKKKKNSFSGHQLEKSVTVLERTEESWGREQK